MTNSDTVTTSPTIPPPQDQHSHHHSPPQNQLNSNPISAAPPRVSMEDYVNSYGILTDKIQEQQQEHSSFKYLDTKECGDRFERYETELKEYLLAKYFSGEGMFEASTKIDDETIKSSRWACVRWYADPEILDEDLEQCVDDEEVEEQEEEVESVDSPAVVEMSRGGEIASGVNVSDKNGS